MGWLSYRNGRRVLEDKIAKELTSITSQTARELDLWLKERHYEIRVFASSYEVSENLERIAGAQREPAQKNLALSRLGDYLRSVEQRFADYDELTVLDSAGAAVATSAAQADDLHLPADWREKATTEGLVIGAPYWDSNRNEMAMVLAEPVWGARDRLLGILAAKISLKRIDSILKDQAQEGSNQVRAISRGGMILSSFPPLGRASAPASLPAEVARDLFSRGTQPLEFVNVRGQDVVGALQTARRLDWGVVAEKDKATEYAEIARVRNVTFVLVASILVGIGAAAYLLGLTLVRPLDRLIRGAGKVAGGDLEVDLPVYSRGEVGYLTVVFNRMVARLRKAREEIEATNKALIEKNEELHEISITDGLTGLHNRKHMSETVVGEFSRAERHKHPVSILMMDIDRFKTFNDTRGHQAGDEVLRGVARLIRETLRGTDYAARYGGEEFLVLLPYTGQDEAVQTAERIRGRIEEGRLGVYADGVGITLSVGVASYPGSGGNAESVIREADLALYRAKRDGRNRVVSARTVSALGSQRPS